MLSRRFSALNDTRNSSDPGASSAGTLATLASVNASAWSSLCQTEAMAPQTCQTPSCHDRFYVTLREVSFLPYAFNQMQPGGIASAPLETADLFAQTINGRRGNLLRRRL